MIALWRFGWGAVRSMGTGDYICVTLRGGAPWGFTLREGEGDTYRPFLVSQVSISMSDHVLVVKFINTKVFIWDKTGSFQVCFRNLMKRSYKLPSVDYKCQFIEFSWVIQRKKRWLKTSWTNSGGRCIFVCVGLCFWCEIPRDPYMVKAKRECEAEGSVSCYHSRRLIAGKQSIFQTKPEWKICALRTINQRKQTKRKSGKTKIWPWRYHFKRTVK